MIRIDHLAYRCADRDSAVKFFIEAFNYRIQEEFEITLEDGSKAKCMSLEPSLKKMGFFRRLLHRLFFRGDLHIPPEIFVSSGPPGSLIDNWVKEWGRGVGGIHHIAFQVDDAKAQMIEWQSKGWLFTTEDVLKCEDLTQVFSKPNPTTGIIYEFIERKGQRGFCKANVSKLMSSTKNLT